MKHDNKILIFIPTYNESENVGPLADQLLALGPQFDILFLDDHSPDGTGQLLDKMAQKNPSIQVIHRTGKLGIGSAHKVGISRAYEKGYKTLVTMDADFTHSPSDIPKLIDLAKNFDVVVGTRYNNQKSLEGWNLMRRFLTWTGHFLTIVCLNLKYDATGAFRLYRLDRVPLALFNRVKSNGYSFFFESLHIVNLNQYKIGEVSILLPPRTYGHSKMSYREIFKSVHLLFKIWMRTLFFRKQMHILPEEKKIL